MAAYLTIQNGTQKGKSFSLERQEKWVLGAQAEKCDILLEDPSLSDQELCIEKKGNLYVVSSSCFINKKPSEPFQELKEGDILELGKIEIRFSYKAPKKASSEFDTIFDEYEEEPDILSQDLQEPSEEPEKPPLQEESSKEVFQKEYGRTAYDTIFEDSDDPENLPFNLMDSSSLLLKVISGPNAGAEISIQKNRSYILGKDPHSCDIVFQDLSVSTNHAKLSVSEKGIIEIEDLGSKNGTLIDSHPFEGKKEITPENLIQMGTTTFLVIDREMGSETIYSPFGYKGKKEEEFEEVEEKEEKKETFSWKELIIPKSHLTIAAASAVILFTVFLSFFSLLKSEPIAVSEKRAKENIEKALEKFESVQFSFNPSSGKLFLVGHVLTPVDHQELLHNIEQVSSVEGIEDNLIIDEYVWKNTNDIFSEKEAFKGVFLHSAKAGEFILSGFVKTEEDKEVLQEYINIHFSQLDHLENQVVVESVLSQEIRSLFLQKGFGAISFQLIEGDLIVQGRFNGEKKREFSSLLSHLQKIPGITRVKNIAISSDAESVAIDLSDKYQVTGFAKKDQQDFNVMINGRVLSVGESIDGMVLKRILPNMVLFEKEGISYRIDYTR